MKRSLLLVAAWLSVDLVSISAADKPLLLTAEHSRIEIEVKATVGSFVGQLSDYQANVIVDDRTGTVKSAVLGFMFDAVKTGDEKRDVHMNTWQETGKYPNARFEMTHLEASANAAHFAVGRLTLHGKTNEIRFPVTILNEGDTMVIDGEADLDTQSFGLPIIRKFLALKVNPVVTVRFHLQGKVPAAS